VQFHY